MFVLKEVNKIVFWYSLISFFTSFVTTIATTATFVSLTKPFALAEHKRKI